VYVAWSTRTTAGGRIVVAKSTNGGTTWSNPTTVSTATEGYAFFQGLDVAPGGRIDIGYQALKISATGSPTTYGTGNATINSWYATSTNGGTTWSTPMKVSTAGSDPAASAQNNLRRQFWGDYNTLASASTSALFIYTDSRTGAGCTAVDAFQHAVDGSGPSAPKPAPETACSNQQFGNTDAFVSKITP
jgi:hypothetical protein